MINLTDTQAILLSTASQREDGSVLPLPASIALGGRGSKALAVLLKHRLAEEHETRNGAAVHRTDGDIRYGVFLTPAGATAIGVELPTLAVGGDTALSAPVLGRVPAATSPKPPSKAAAVLALLSRPGGATLSELIEATGWLPHTTRAALTSLRKKGHAIVRCTREGTTCYRIVAA